ncbi:MAG: hypothetical protein IJZ00_02075 [Lachnospiraceae bacterium]|nr:hypothetical protein [Lachnospiraceae bacterium]
MLSDKEHEEIRNALSFFKKDIESRSYITHQLDDLSENVNVLVIRSARAELYLDFLEQISKFAPRTNLYVLGELDEQIKVYEKDTNLNISHLKINGRFSTEKINEYKMLIKGIEIYKIVYLNPTVHSPTIFNIYDVIIALNLHKTEVIKYMGKSCWMKYASFLQYVKALKAYTASYEWYMCATEEE